MSPGSGMKPKISCDPLTYLLITVDPGQSLDNLFFLAGLGTGWPLSYGLLTQGLGMGTAGMETVETRK